VRAGADQMAKANGMTVFHYIPTSTDNAPQQTFLVEEALRQKRDAIVFTPVDVKVMVPSVQKINAAGIPLVNVGDRIAAAMPSPSSATTTTPLRSIPPLPVQSDGGQGQLIILEGPETIPTAVGRLRGFKDVLKEFPNIKVVLSKNALYARPAAKDLLTQC